MSLNSVSVLSVSSSMRYVHNLNKCVDSYFSTTLKELVKFREDKNNLPLSLQAWLPKFIFNPSSKVYILLYHQKRLRKSNCGPLLMITIQWFKRRFDGMTMARWYLTASSSWTHQGNDASCNDKAVVVDVEVMHS